MKITKMRQVKVIWESADNEVCGVEVYKLKKTMRTLFLVYV